MGFTYIPHSPPPTPTCPSSLRTHSFFIGQPVEVLNNPPGSHYEATVISHDTNNNSYVVEYNTLLNDEDNYSFLRKTVGPNNLRPLPEPVDSSLTASGFSLNQLVDVYDEEGWWVTQITGRKESHYSYFVYCYWNPENREFHSSELRVHQEWFGGDNWILF